MKLLIATLLSVSTAATPSLPSLPTIDLTQEPTTRVIITDWPTLPRFEGMEINPETRGYMLVIPPLPDRQQEPNRYTLEPDPSTQTPNLDVPNFKFQPLETPPKSPPPKP